MPEDLEADEPFLKSCILKNKSKLEQIKKLKKEPKF